MLNGIKILRFQGKIKSWNEAKGFGFIAPNDGSKDVFIHISKFENTHKKPRINSLVTYEISLDKSKRHCAVNARYVGDKSELKLKTKTKTSNLGGKILNLLVFSIILFVINDIYKHRGSTLESSMYKATHERDYQKSNYSCEGKTYCSEMKSCGEALFYQENCSATEMDGDRDGIPCEQQWCN